LNEKRTLAAAYRFYCGKDLHKAHSALGDAEATLDVLTVQVLKYGNKDEGLDSLKKFDYARSVEYFDKDRRFRWWNGRLYPVFGRYARKKSLQEIAESDVSYLEWILSSDFSPEVKEMIQGVILGKFPTKP